MDHKIGRSEKTGKLTYEAPRVRRVRLDAAGSLLICLKDSLFESPCWYTEPWNS